MVTKYQIIETSAKLSKTKAFATVRISSILPNCGSESVSRENLYLIKKEKLKLWPNKKKNNCRRMSTNAN